MQYVYSLLKMFIILLFCIVNIPQLYAGEYCDANFIVETNQGSLQGKVNKDYYGNPFYSFEGIPYGKPPIGELRFKAPQPAEPWSGVLDATQRPELCAQTDHGQFLGVEDCLYLNVYTPELPKCSSDGTLKAVMVYIHGGGFRFGTPYDTDPGLLIAKDIIFVNVLYRLDIFGFLSFEDPKLGVPGNAGLKDLVLALKWVQKNIKSFGGDPDNVTIFGHSAGGAATNLLLLSPMGKGLFHKVISQGGCAFNNWVEAPRRYRSIGQLLKCGSTEQAKIFECISKKPAQELSIPLLDLTPLNQIHVGELDGFSCVVEIGPSEGAFLSEPLENIITEGKFNDVPFLTGFATNEGAIMVTSPHVTVPINVPDVKALVPRDMAGLDEIEKSRIFGEKIKNFYYGSLIPGPDTMKNYVDFYTDVMFIEKIIDNSKRHANLSKSPVYLYNFNYYTELNFMQNLTNPIITHADDLQYLFVMKNTPSSLEPNSNAAIGVHRLVTLWTTFAKTGNPNPIEHDPLLNVRWEPISDTAFNYLEISPNMRLLTDPQKHRMNFWKDLYAEARNWSMKSKNNNEI